MIAYQWQLVQALHYQLTKTHDLSQQYCQCLRRSDYLHFYSVSNGGFGTFGNSWRFWSTHWTNIKYWNQDHASVQVLRDSTIAFQKALKIRKSRRGTESSLYGVLCRYSVQWEHLNVPYHVMLNRTYTFIDHHTFDWNGGRFWMSLSRWSVPFFEGAGPFYLLRYSGEDKRTQDWWWSFCCVEWRVSSGNCTSTWRQRKNKACHSYCSYCELCVYPRCVLFYLFLSSCPAYLLPSFPLNSHCLQVVFPFIFNPMWPPSTQYSTDQM